MAASKGALRHGDRAAREVSERIAGNFASTTAMAAITPKFRADGMIATVGLTVWLFDIASTASASATVIVPADSPTAGRWLALVAGATPVVQSGTLTLVAGTKTINTGVVITATSRIFYQRTAQGGTSTAVANYDTTNKTAGVAGVGAFTVQASTVAGVIVNTDTSTLDYVIIG
jgi:hypothetical protein